MYHFISCFINVTDLSVDVAWQVPVYHLVVCQSTSCLHLLLLFLYFDNWLSFNLDTSKKYDYYI